MVAEREDKMANYFEVPVGEPQESTCSCRCGCEVPLGGGTCVDCSEGTHQNNNKVNLCECGADGEWYADNNGSEELLWYCGPCDDRRAEKFGCARIIKEGCGCFPGGEDCACGCVGTGRL